MHYHNFSLYIPQVGLWQIIKQQKLYQCLKSMLPLSTKRIPSLDYNLFLTISSPSQFMSRIWMMMNTSPKFIALWHSLNRIDAEMIQLYSSNRLILTSKSSMTWLCWWIRIPQHLAANRHLNMQMEYGQDISIKYSLWLPSQIKHLSMKWCCFTVISTMKP